MTTIKYLYHYKPQYICRGSFFGTVIQYRILDKGGLV